MNNVLLYFIGRYKAFLFFLLIFSYMGFSYFLHGPKKVFQPVDTNVIEIVADYPGATPVEIEKEIVLPIEAALKGNKGYQKVLSYSIAGEGKVHFYLDPRYTGSVTEVIEDIRSALKRVHEFPKTMDKKPIVKRLQLYSDPQEYFAIYGDNMVDNIRVFDQIYPSLSKIQDVSSVSTEGYDALEVWIEIEPTKLAIFDTGVLKVEEAIRKRNVNLSGGKVSANNLEYSIRVSQQYVSLDEIANTVVQSNDVGRSLRVKDVATVSWHSRNTAMKMFVDGKPAIFIGIKTMDSADGLLVRSLVHNKIDTMKQNVAELKEGKVFIESMRDRTVFLKSRYESMTYFIIVAFVLMILTFYLHKGFSFTIWTALSFFLSMGTTLSLMNFSSVSMNLVSLFSLMMVMYFMINISFWSLEEVLPQNTKNMSATDFASHLEKYFTPFMTNILMLLSLVLAVAYFSSYGIQIVKVLLPITLMACSSVLLVNYFIIPSFYFNYNRGDQRGKRQWFIDSIERLSNVGLLITKRFMKFPKKSVLIRLVYASLILTLSFVLLPKEPFSSDFHGVNVKLVFNHDYSLNKTKGYVDKLIGDLKNERKGIDFNVYSNVGSLQPLNSSESGSRSYWATITFEEGDISYGDIEDFKMLIEQKKATYGIDTFEVTGDEIYKRLEEPSVTVRMIGDDLNELYDVKKEVYDALQESGSMKMKSLYDEPLKSMTFRLNSEKVTFTGVNIDEVTEVLKSSFQGSLVTSASGLLSRDVDIQILFDQQQLVYENEEAFRKKLSTILVTNKRGVLVPIDKLVDILKEKSQPFVERLNGERIIELAIYTPKRNWLDLVHYERKIKGIIQTINASHPNVTVGVALDWKEYFNYFKETIFFVLTTFFLAFVVVVIIVRSYSMGLSILFSTLTAIATYFTLYLVTMLVCKLFGFSTTFYTFDVYSLIVLSFLISLAIGNASLIYSDVLKNSQMTSLENSLLESVTQRKTFFSLQFLYLMLLSFFGGIIAVIFKDVILLSNMFYMSAGLVGVTLSTLSYPAYSIIFSHFQSKTTRLQREGKS